MSKMDIRNRHFEPMSSEEWIRLVSNNEFTKDELGWIYCCGMMGWCLLTDPENLPTVTKAMLDRGMDPNQLVTDKVPDENKEANWYDTPLISVTRFEDDLSAAPALKLLLERGGDPNTMHLFGDFEENVFEFYEEDEFVHGPDLDCRSFYGLLLCAAYGGKRHRDGRVPFSMLIDEPISIFKDYERYWYEYEKHENYSSTLYVIEKETGNRVARYH